MDNALLSPEDLKKIDVLNESRKTLYDFLHQASKVKTPRQFVKKKGDFDTVEFEYLNEQMNKWHPHRKIEIVSERFDAPSMTFMCSVHITDLQTGEIRAGVGCHPVVAYGKNSETMNSMKKIREQMSNAMKGALTEAVRDAMAHFGIAADMFGMDFPDPVSKAQLDRFEDYMLKVEDGLDYLEMSDDVKQSVVGWMKKQFETFKDLLASNADKFFNEFKEKAESRLANYKRKE